MLGSGRANIQWFPVPILINRVFTDNSLKICLPFWLSLSLATRVARSLGAAVCWGWLGDLCSPKSPLNTRSYFTMVKCLLSLKLLSTDWQSKSKLPKLLRKAGLTAEKSWAHSKGTTFWCGSFEFSPLLTWTSWKNTDNYVCNIPLVNNVFKFPGLSDLEVK